MKNCWCFSGNEEDCEVIIPHIQSPATCGTSESAPRIQNKCLSTWGFSSTTFSGEPISGSTSWTVTIERNTAAGGSHLTSCNTGYLFGIGVSSEVCTEVSLRNSLFTLPDPDLDSNSDCKTNRYIVTCRTFHTAWSQIQISIVTIKHRNGIGIGISLCECK